MSTTAADARGGLGGPLVSLVVDLVVPVAGYYVLRACGLGPVPALVLAGAPTAAAIAYRSARRHRMDTLGAFVLVVLAGSVALTFVTGSPRFLLAREAWFTAAIGAGFLVSLRFRRPAAYSIARSMLHHSRLGSTLAVDAWEVYWPQEPWFRRTWRVTTVLWAGGLIVDAAIRVVMAYTLPVDTVPGLAGALWAVTFVALQAMQHLYFTRVGLWTWLRGRAAHSSTAPT